ncbi:AraC family transcriptional regulator [Aquimarina sp. AD1]|uniref:helix-turn-helix domain-containing protein n=3 Tax=Aquimarina sp. (strain AD1) TaxID=1714848 RepID=UPI000E4EEAE0|nr:helix-turn-helix domain-containing protein [Aquimarina sp. AD1]AXT56547.1 AraC family transcriptional regulator [Aquimarina sp. AD1]
MKNRLLVTFLISSFCFFGITNAQEDDADQDTLLQKKYEELLESFEYYKSDTIHSKVFALTYLQKAKQERDIIRQADGYYMLSEITEQSKALAYGDSIIMLTKNIKDFNYPAKGHLLKARIYGGKSQFKKAMDELVLSNKYANENENIDQQYKTKYFIALLKEDLGKSLESLESLKSIVNYYGKQFKDDHTYEYDYIKSLFALGSSFNKNKIYDSAYTTNNKAINLSLKSKDSTLYGRLLLSSGRTHYYKDEYTSSLDSILKFKKISKNKPQSIGTSIRADLFLGKIYAKQKNQKASLIHLQKMDSLAYAKNYYFPTIRSGYELLIKTYEEKEDINKQLLYINKLLYVDSILDTNYKQVYVKINDDYTTPNLILEKEHIINSLQKNNKNTIITVGILLLLIISLILILVRNVKKRKVFQQRFLDLYEQNSHSEQEKTDPVTNQISETPAILNKNDTIDIGISEIIINDILKHLNTFEKNKDFIKTNITINALSKEFKTNSKYLSKIINTYKGKSFSNYINELRIDFVVEKLKSDSKFRKYTIKAIANDIGFNTTDAFSRSFHKKTGIFPSFFLKQLEKKQNEEEKIIT